MDGCYVTIVLVPPSFLSRHQLWMWYNPTSTQLSLSPGYRIPLGYGNHSTPYPARVGPYSTSRVCGVVRVRADPCPLSPTPSVPPSVVPYSSSRDGVGDRGQGPPSIRPSLQEGWTGGARGSSPRSWLLIWSHSSTISTFCTLPFQGRVPYSTNLLIE